MYLDSGGECLTRKAAWSTLGAREVWGRVVDRETAARKSYEHLRQGGAFQAPSRRFASKDCISRRPSTMR